MQGSSFTFFIYLFSNPWFDPRSPISQMFVIAKSSYQERKRGLITQSLVLYSVSQNLPPQLLSQVDGIFQPTPRHHWFDRLLMTSVGTGPDFFYQGYFAITNAHDKMQNLVFQQLSLLITYIFVLRNYFTMLRSKCYMVKNIYIMITVFVNLCIKTVVSTNKYKVCYRGSVVNDKSIVLERQERKPR